MRSDHPQPFALQVHRGFLCYEDQHVWAFISDQDSGSRPLFGKLIIVGRDQWAVRLLDGRVLVVMPDLNPDFDDVIRPSDIRPTLSVQAYY